MGRRVRTLGLLLGRFLGLLLLAGLQRLDLRLHPVLAALGAADARLRREASLADGRLAVPGRSAIVWVR